MRVAHLKPPPQVLYKIGMAGWPEQHSVVHEFGARGQHVLDGLGVDDVARSRASDREVVFGDATTSQPRPSRPAARRVRLPEPCGTSVHTTAVDLWVFSTTDLSDALIPR